MGRGVPGRGSGFLDIVGVSGGLDFLRIGLDDQRYALC